MDNCAKIVFCHCNIIYYYYLDSDIYCDAYCIMCVILGWQYVIVMNDCLFNSNQKYTIKLH